MSNKRYLDINSLYRDRLKYPNPCDFVLLLNSLSAVTSATAKDPILLGFPYETNLLQGGSTTTQIALSVEASNILDFYVGSWIEIGGYFRQVTAYDPTLKAATVAIAFPVAYPVLTLYTIRYELPTLRDFAGANSVQLNEIFLNAGASSLNNFYKDQWVFIPGSSPPTSYKWYRIISYDGTTKKAVIAGKFASLVTAGTVFEVMPFSYENARALQYYGTEVGTNNASCVSINLVNLILPNLPLLDGYHGTLQNYPYLYVAVYSERSQPYTNVIVSNNPASNLALFKVPVTYLQGLSYLTLGYTGMSPNVSFRLDDDLRFRILLPDGEVLQFDTGTLSTSYVSGQPVPGNPISQVQAVFEVTRLS